MQTGNSATQHLQNGYQLAYEKACAKLAAITNPEELATNSGVGFDRQKNVFSFKYINDIYAVSYPDGKVSFVAHDGEVPVTTKIVLLHYLLSAGGQALTGQLVSFKEIPGAMIYLQPFTGRVLGGFKAVFGKKISLLPQAGEKIGAQPAKFGDAAVTLDILPRLPITYVIWEGDEEFPSNATVLFDSTAQYYLPTEDLVVAAAAGASLLSKTARTLS